MKKMMINILAIAATASVTIGCGASIAKSNPPTHSPPVATATTAASSATASAPTPMPSPTKSLSGPIGTSFTVTTQDDNGDNVEYIVEAVKVDQHAGLGQYETLANPGDHMVAIKFSITGVTGQASDDANSDAVAIGTDTTEYSPSFTSITDGPNFNDGEFEVSPGQTVSGWVAFEVPASQNVASVQWMPDAMDDGGAATWTIGS